MPKAYYPPVVTVQNVFAHHQMSPEGKITQLRTTGLPVWTELGPAYISNLNQQPHQSSFPKTKHSGLRAGTCAVPSAWEPEMSPPCVRFPPVPDGKRVPCLHCFPPHHLVSFFRGTLSLPDVSSSSVKAKTVSTSPPLHPQHLDNVSRWP